MNERHYNVISADGHLEIVFNRWRHRVQEKHWDVMPHLVKHEDGADNWRIEIDGRSWERSTSGNVVADWTYDEFVPSRPKYFREDGTCRPGTGDAIQRLQEQDLDGLDAEVLYPPSYHQIFFRHGLKEHDIDAYHAFIKGYNDYLAEEYCSVAPDRLIGVGGVPETGVDNGIREMERIRDKGIRAIALTAWPNGGPHYIPEDDRFFAASIDLGMKLAPHAGFGEPKPPAPGAASLTRDTILDPRVNKVCYPIGQLVVNGVFDRYPSLQIYFAETQAGWLAYALNWMDEIYLRWCHYVDVHLPRMPSEYYRQHCKFSFVVDRMAMELRNYIGIEMLMFGTDFPHSLGSFPDTRSWLDDLFEGVSEADRRRVLVDNVCEFFELDPKAPLTPTPTRAATEVGS